MTTATVIITIISSFLGSSVLTAIISAITDKKRWERQRKAMLEDKGDGRDAAIEALTEEVKGLRIDMAEMSKQISQMDEDGIIYYYDQIKHLALKAITENKITLANREHLIKMHDVYHRRGGNGNLDDVMNRVKELPISDYEITA